MVHRRSSRGSRCCSLLGRTDEWWLEASCSNRHRGGSKCSTVEIVATTRAPCLNYFHVVHEVHGIMRLSASSRSEGTWSHNLPSKEDQVRGLDSSTGTAESFSFSKRARLAACLEFLCLRTFQQITASINRPFSRSDQCLFNHLSSFNWFSYLGWNETYSSGSSPHETSPPPYYRV